MKSNYLGTLVRCLPLLAILVLQGTGVRAQVIFDDPFERTQLGDFWDGHGGWTIRDGRAYNGVDSDWTPLTTTQSFNATSYVLETEVAGLVDGYQRAYYLLFGQQDDSGRAGYVLRYDPLGAGTLVLGESNGNYLYPDVLDRAIIDLDPTTAHAFRIEKYENGLIQVYIGDGNDFVGEPILETVHTDHPSLGKVSWTTFTQSVGEEFFVEYVRATVPNKQKTEGEKPAEDEVVAQIEASSDKSYTLGRLTEGETIYTDRPYVLTHVPDFLENARFIKTANDDKRSSAAEFLTVYIKQPTIAYVAYDPRGGRKPAWLDSWTKIDATIGTTDPGTNYHEIYTKVVPFAVFSPTPHVLRLGGNLAAPAAGANTNYIVALVPAATNTRYEAEEAVLSGVRPASKHPGYSGKGFADYINPTKDYVEWTVDVKATSPYRLGVGFANGSDAARTLQLSVDGEVITSEAFYPTGRWANWAFRSLGKAVLLSAGEHKIRLTAIGQSGPNVDYLQLTPTSVYTPPAKMARYANSNARIMPATDYEPLGVSTFPNPAVNAITIRMSGGGAEVGNLRIFDARGQEVYHERVGASDDGETRRRINVSAWPTGTYVYRLRRGGEVVMGRFVRG